MILTGSYSQEIMETTGITTPKILVGSTFCEAQDLKTLEVFLDEHARATPLSGIIPPAPTFSPMRVVKPWTCRLSLRRGRQKGGVGDKEKPRVEDGKVGDSVGRNRQQAIHEAKDRAGVPRSQQPSRQWEVGNDPKRRGMKNYKYDENPSSHGRYQEFKDANGHKKVVVDHVNDPNRATKHAHAGKAKSGQDPRDVDFKDGPRYDAIKKDGDHHIDYD